MTRALVLGGGVAGLTAAWRLLQLRPDWEVTVVEQERHPGGLAAGFGCGEFRADLGPHRIFTELPEIETLLPELLASVRVIDVPRRSQLMLGGHLYEYPVRAMELLRHMGPVRTAGLAASALAGRLASAGRTPVSFEDAMVAKFGRGVFDLIVGPYAAKVWKEEPGRISEELARVRVSAGDARGFVRRLVPGGGKARKSALTSLTYIEGGVEKLVECLRTRVETAGGTVRLCAKAAGLAVEGDRIRAARMDDDGAGKSIEADCFVSTIPVTDLAAMLPVPPAAKEAAGQLEFVGLVLVMLVVARPRVTHNCWLYFPEEQYVFNRAYEPRNFDTSIPASDRAPIVFEVTARWDSDLWSMDAPTLLARVRADAARTGILKEEEIVDTALIKLPHVYPLYRTGYRDSLAAVLGGLRRFGNLLTTGRQGLFNHNNMDHSMLMGLRAADYAARGPDNIAGPWLDDLDQFSHFRIVD